MPFDLHLYCVGTFEQQRILTVFWFSAQAAQNCSVVLFYNLLVSGLCLVNKCTPYLLRVRQHRLCFFVAHGCIDIGIGWLGVWWTSVASLEGAFFWCLQCELMWADYLFCHIDPACLAFSRACWAFLEFHWNAIWFAFVLCWHFRAAAHPDSLLVFCSSSAELLRGFVL